MIELLSKLIAMLNDDLVDPNTLKNFPNLAVHFYSKDKNGKYLHCNDAMAHAVGFNDSTVIIGQTDFDFSWSKEAMRLRENDLKVISRHDPMLFIESSIMYNGHSYAKTDALSYKKPLYTSSKKIIGIVGISIMPSIYELSKKATINAQQWREFFKISPREYDCLYHLAYGKSAKQAALLLQISPRTVEEYLTSAKKKLNCADRSRLIEKIIDLGIL